MVVFFRLLRQTILGMDGMAAGASRINAALNRANGISGRNKENIDALASSLLRLWVFLYIHTKIPRFTGCWEAPGFTME
jgi:hypothetical protein